jgi:hypothetical protein
LLNVAGLRCGRAATTVMAVVMMVHSGAAAGLAGGLHGLRGLA